MISLIHRYDQFNKRDCWYWRQVYLIIIYGIFGLRRKSCSGAWMLWSRGGVFPAPGGVQVLGGGASCPDRPIRCLHWTWQLLKCAGQPPWQLRETESAAHVPGWTSSVGGWCKVSARPFYGVYCRAQVCSDGSAQEPEGPRSCASYSPPWSQMIFGLISMCSARLTHPASHRSTSSPFVADSPPSLMSPLSIGLTANFLFPP